LRGRDMLDEAGKLRFLLDEYGFAPGVELGDCMEPSIRKGESVLVEKARPEDIKLGDAVVFKRGKKVYAHRVHGKTRVAGEFFFITRGDREPAFDQPVSWKIVLGRVVNQRKTTQGVHHAVIYALLAVYYVNKKVGRMIPVYRLFSRFACWVT